MGDPVSIYRIFQFFVPDSHFFEVLWMFFLRTKSRKELSVFGPSKPLQEKPLVFDESLRPSRDIETPRKADNPPPKEMASSTKVGYRSHHLIFQHFNYFPPLRF